MLGRTALFALLAGLVACEDLLGQLDQGQNPGEETGDGTVDGTDEGTIGDTTDGEPEPRVNPYAYVGEAHNDYLACTMEFIDMVAGDTAEEQAAIVMDVLATRCDYPDGPELEIAGDISLVGEELHGTGVAMGLSEAELDILADADDILRTYEPGEALLGLEQLELTALETLGDDSAGVLAALATARASGAYWIDDEPNEDEPRRAKWWQIVLADAAGALVGSIAGPQGSITLGVTASTLVAK